MLVVRSISELTFSGKIGCARFAIIQVQYHSTDSMPTLVGLRDELLSKEHYFCNWRSACSCGVWAK